MTKQILNHTIVAEERNERFHRDFPDLTVLPDGDVLVLLRECGPWARQATYGFPSPLTFFEIEPQFVLYRSKDRGKTFQRENIVFDGFAFDPTIRVLNDGTLFAGVVAGSSQPTTKRAELTGIFHRHIPEMNTVIGVDGLHFATSVDEGISWEYQPIIAIPGWQNHYNLRKPFQAPDGTLLVPITSGYPWQSRHVGVIRSFDGKNWGDTSVVTKDIHANHSYSAGIGYWEPVIAALRDGTLICVMVQDMQSSAPQRNVSTQPRAGVFTDYLPSLWVSFSTDYGFTWSIPQDSGLRGDFPSIHDLGDGELCLTYTARYPDHSELVCNQTTDGTTWNHMQIIHVEYGANFYYPNSTILANGNNLTVFMHAGQDKLRTTHAIVWKD